MIHLDDLKLCAKFVECLQRAIHYDPSLSLSEDAVSHLHNPSHRQSSPPLDIELQVTLKLYLVNPSEATYKANCAVFLCYSLHINIPSYYKTMWLVLEITSIELVVHYMCINLCIAYTGPFLDLKACPICLEL